MQVYRIINKSKLAVRFNCGGMSYFLKPNEFVDLECINSQIKNLELIGVFQIKEIEKQVELGPVVYSTSKEEDSEEVKSEGRKRK